MAPASLLVAASTAQAQLARQPTAQQLGEGSRQPGDSVLPIPHASPRPRASANGWAARPWSVRIAESVMRRNPQTHRRWDYTGGVVLGGNVRRDGSFEYYVSEPVVTDGYKGVGPFILAALELNR